MDPLKHVLIEQSDEIWDRIRQRVDGLRDDEYFWEPARGCWTVRQRLDGSWMADWPLPRPDPEPFTTIAWRMWHLIDMYGEDRAPRWLGVPPQGTPIGMDDPHGSPPATAAEAVRVLASAHERWDLHLALASADSLAEQVGPVAGPRYATRSRAAYVLHMLDEFIHHGAEIALLRDLWRWQQPIVDDPIVERIIRGDSSDIDALVEDGTSEPIDVAASYGRWDLVTSLVRQGRAIRATGRTPLHLAAGAGELDVVRLLLDHGADPTARDPEFQATPAEWADFLHHPNVANFLRQASDRQGGSPTTAG